MTTQNTAPEVAKKRDWETQVYDPEGKWVGFFLDETTAQKWVGKRKGFEITNRKPDRPDREGLDEAVQEVTEAPE